MCHNQKWCVLFSTCIKPVACVLVRVLARACAIARITWRRLQVHIIEKDNKLHAFQFKLLNDVLYLNKMFFKFGKIGSPLCPCNLKGKTLYHLFYECIHKNYLWNQVHYFLSNCLNIPLLTPQSAIFSLINQQGNFLILNHLLLTFKFHTYNSRSSDKLNIKFLKTVIYKTRDIELDISKTTTRKQKYINKQQPISITKVVRVISFLFPLLLIFSSIYSFIVLLFFWFSFCCCCCCCCFLSFTLLFEEKLHFSSFYSLIFLKMTCDSIFELFFISPCANVEHEFVNNL